jgi:hypothetical protein
MDQSTESISPDDHPSRHSRWRATAKPMGWSTASPPTVLAGSLSAAANWLELNVRRSLDGAAGDRAVPRAEAEVANALNKLAWRMTWRTDGQNSCSGVGGVRIRCVGTLPAT